MCRDLTELLDTPDSINTTVKRKIIKIWIRLNDFQFMTFVSQLNEALREIIFHISTENRDLYLIKSILLKIWRAVEDFNKRFGFSLFCTVTSNFVCCCFNTLYNIAYHVLYFVFTQCVQQVSLIDIFIITIFFLIYFSTIKSWAILCMQIKITWTPIIKT